MSVDFEPSLLIDFLTNQVFSMCVSNKEYDCTNCISNVSFIRAESTNDNVVTEIITTYIVTYRPVLPAE